MKRLLFIINAPSPYRWHSFNVIYRVASEHGIEFSVVFLTHQSKPHPWSIKTLGPADFPYSAPWGINVQPSRMAYLNPAFILKTIGTKWDWIIFGGYDTPTNLLLILLPLLHTKLKVIRNEGNPYNRGAEAGLLGWLKRYLLTRCDVYLIPGKRGIEWLARHQIELKNKSVHVFPNAVNDTYYIEQSRILKVKSEILKKKWNVPVDKRLFVSVARLSPEKGVVEFIRKLPPAFGKKNFWLIAGDGPQRDAVEAALKQCGQQMAVKLMGYVAKDLVPELYAIADVFLLPSLRDANPLSAIEAAFSSLPLLMSQNAGNSPELVLEGRTGWSFDPFEGDSIMKALSEAIRATDEEIGRMGKESFSNAIKNFSSETTVTRLIEFLLEIHPAR